MAAVTFPFRVQPSATGIRPLDPLHDLPAVVALIELGFRREMDPQGQKMLARLRRMARASPVERLILGAPNSPPGLVWVEDEHVVGNLSLRRAAGSSNQGYLIGNVVVHPDYQGRGIGHALMKAAIETTRRRKGHWIGLEVNANNEVARRLYERLGFRDAGYTEHLLRPAGLPWPDGPATQVVWRKSSPKDGALWAALAGAIYRRFQARVLEVQRGRYSFGGWERQLTLWSSRQRESAWLQAAETPRLAVRIHTDRRYRFHLWELLAHPLAGGRGSGEVVARALAATRRAPSWPVISMIAATESALLAVLQALGFRRHRTLLQMTLTRGEF
ncbi:MAG: GNAT family N-acetyltransferase [Chloroflexota bacterium]|nr:GNAT family N-acetyltransferase [Chloroflexota bacterium]